MSTQSDQEVGTGIAPAYLRAVLSQMAYEAPDDDHEGSDNNNNSSEKEESD